MKICHIAPFGPNRCGLYEAARDMAKADSISGHEIIFIDAGITENGKKQPPKINAVDDRIGFRLQTGSINLINLADIIVLHTGVTSDWIVKTQAPIIWIIHGRPLACFRPELNKQGNYYTLYKELASWPRTKKFIYFWPEFNDHWKIQIPESKLHSMLFPVIDEQQFSSNGKKIDLESSGKHNFLICDSERIDIDLYELVIGCIKASEKIDGLKFHFFGMTYPIPDCWQVLLGRLKDLGSLGMVKGRIANMPEVYRSMDCTISPNRIITRTISESLSCGIPVICQNGKHTIADLYCEMSDPNDIVEAIELFIDMKNEGIDKNKIVERSKVFNMNNYSKEMNKIYQKILDLDCKQDDSNKIKSMTSNVSNQMESMFRIG